MPICTPTRSALMTARDPMKLGSAYAGFQPWQNGGVSPQEHFMPESFKAAGYQTAMVGKWHLSKTNTEGDSIDGVRDAIIECGFEDVEVR